MNLLAQLKPVKLIAMDVDGVLTDGSLFLLNDGQMARTMNIKDGYALQLAVKKGYHLLVISGAAGDIGVISRLEKLGIKEIHTGVTDKAALLIEKMKSLNISNEEALFIGDDIPDLLAMQQVGFPCCPSDAVPEIKNISKYISSENGGKGCVRDIIEKLLKLNNHWDLNAGVSSK